MRALIAKQSVCNTIRSLTQKAFMDFVLCGTLSVCPLLFTASVRLVRLCYYLLPSNTSFGFTFASPFRSEPCISCLHIISAYCQVSTLKPPNHAFHVLFTPTESRPLRLGSRTMRIDELTASNTALANIKQSEKRILNQLFPIAPATLLTHNALPIS